MSWYEVGFCGRQLPVVPRVHRLKHVERLAAPYLADDDPIRSHAQGVPNQVAHGDLPTPFHRGRPTLPTPLWQPSSSTGSLTVRHHENRPLGVTRHCPRYSGPQRLRRPG